MSLFGDVYHEGKELEYKLRMKRPGQLSEELKKALGIYLTFRSVIFLSVIHCAFLPSRVCVGLTTPLIPTPWLVNMQRYGPPPAYPNMKITGLNTPIPPGARYGYGDKEWGKPPVDEVCCDLDDTLNMHGFVLCCDCHVHQAGRPVYGDPFGVYTEQEAAVWRMRLSLC